MKKISFILMGIVLFTVSGLNIASACSVLPVNPIAQKNELVAKGLTKLNISIENTESIIISDYKGEYIWTPMCPKGVKASATVAVTFQNVEDPLTKGCMAIIKVAKDIDASDNQVYSFDVVQPATCLE